MLIDSEILKKEIKAAFASRLNMTETAILKLLEDVEIKTMSVFDDDGK